MPVVRSATLFVLAALLGTGGAWLVRLAGMALIMRAPRNGGWTHGWPTLSDDRSHP